MTEAEAEHFQCNPNAAIVEIKRLRALIPTPSSLRYALEHAGFVVDDIEIERVCRKLGIPVNG